MSLRLLHPTDTPVGGVIILSPSGDVLYMSPRAAHLIKPFAINPTGDPPTLTLPSALHNIGDEVRHQLQASLKQGHGLTSDVTRTIPSSNGPLFVHGRGIPNQYGGNFLTTLVVSESPIPIPLS
jgi:hypothetical protein